MKIPEIRFILLIYNLAALLDNLPWHIATKSKRKQKQQQPETFVTLLVTLS